MLEHASLADRDDDVAFADAVGAASRGVEFAVQNGIDFFVRARAARADGGREDGRGQNGGDEKRNRLHCGSGVCIWVYVSKLDYRWSCCR